MLGLKQYGSPLKGLRSDREDMERVDTGVLCATEVPSGFVMGSLQGELRIGEGLKDERTSPYMLKVRYVDGKIVTIDEDSDVDWMRFISAARNNTEQNTEAATNSSGQVILRTTRRILIGEELLVWYSDKLQRIMNILPVLPSRDRTDQLSYVCQFCSKSFRYPNTLKSHLRFSCASDSASPTMLFSPCQSIPHPKTAFEIGLPIQWPTKSSHVLSSRFDISLLRSLANTVTRNETPAAFRAFKPITKCNERNKSAFKTHRENDSLFVDATRKVPLLPDLEIPSPMKSTISSSSYDLTYRLHSQLFNCSVPSLSSTSFSATPFRSHLNTPSCFLYGCYHHNHLDSPIESLPHHHHPFECWINNEDLRPGTSSADGSVQRWPFHTLLPFSSENCSVVSGGISKVHQNAIIDSPILPDASQSNKSKRGHLCIYCGKFYSRKYGLKIHLRTHTGYKPLKCKVCLRPFGDPSNLNKHIRLHAEGETPYRCEFCGKVLVRRRDLERHIRSRHPTEVSSQNNDDELINVDDISSSSLAVCDNDSEPDHQPVKPKEITCNEIESVA